MKVLYVENILHVNNFLPKKLEPYLAFLWEKLHVHYVNKKSRAVSTFMLMILNVMQPKLDSMSRNTSFSQYLFTFHQNLVELSRCFDSV